ncbi:MAG: 4Fe-4S binding protein [Deltaproteobacteria bacterium]|nr:4Fe-4S binding protein [Deltaproteobacteria bacterium]
MLGVLGQWSFYGIFRCPFVVPFVSCESCPVLTCHGRIFTLFWGFWLGLPLLTLVFGRAFCAWACPGGLVNQLLGKVSWGKLNVQPSRAVWGLFLGLAAALAIWLGLGQPRMAIPIRVGEFFTSVGLTFEHANLWWLVRTGVVLGLVALGLVAANLWCRMACPTGGALELLQRFSLFRVYKTSRCNDCNQCRRVCAMATRPAEANCTNCADCLDSCPVGAIKVGRPGPKA